MVQTAKDTKNQEELTRSKNRKGRTRKLDSTRLSQIAMAVDVEEQAQKFYWIYSYQKFGILSGTHD